MGVNDFHANTSVRAQRFSEKVWRRKLPSMFWYRFMDFPMPGSKNWSDEQYIIGKDGKVKGYKSGEESLIYVVRDLEAGFGDQVTFPEVDALTGEGVLGSSGTTLEGNEESASVSSFAIALETYAHAVADKSPLGRKRIQFDVLKEYGNLMMSWMLARTEKNLWNALYTGTPTTILYPGTNTAVTTLTANTSDYLTMALLRQAKAIAMTDGSTNNGVSNSAATRFIIEPIKMGGKDYYVVVMSQDALLTLKEDAEFKQSLQSAMPRGEDNPIFAGADYITVDGLIIYGHQRAVNLTTGGADGDVPYARIKLLGQRALCFAMGTAPALVEQKSDYGRKIGLGGELMMKAQRPTINGQDYGSLEIRCSINRVTF